MVWAVTANRLLDGGVVYLRADRSWTSAVSDAWSAESQKDTEARLEWARTQEHEVCDPYALDVAREGECLVPRSARERIRAEGPGPTLARLGYETQTGSRRRAG